ncbi:MAG: hypothetical protein P8K08_03105 [Fuerstiella sp.]|nr:hypothetical protein [Fuerstiella sp.]
MTRSGTDGHIEQSKGSSPLASIEVRAAAMRLDAAANVDGDPDFAAYDSFLIHLVKLSGTNAQIDQSKGTSPLSAAEIRTNINNPGGGTTAVAAGSQVLQSVLAEEPDDVDTNPVELNDAFLVSIVLPDLFNDDDENEPTVLLPVRFLRLCLSPSGKTSAIGSMRSKKTVVSL